MSWQTTSFVVLGLGLFAGFAWYERSHPPAKVLALVAALAALAVVGRIAFAPIPNVKPTTDIVLLAGYALGGAPGFCVGAVTALVSNFFFLQGPWTPWQMAAWGGVGAAGGALAWAVRGRELGRVPLALACGLAGVAFGAVMDLHVWTLGAEQTVASYVAVAGTSLPFNAAHVVGNVAFCLLIGPPLVRALRRYRQRAEVRWPAPAAMGGAPGLPGRTAPLAAVAAALLVGASLLAPADAKAGGGTAAASYLQKAQNGDGGFGADPGAASNQLYSGWAALGLAAAGKNPADVAKGGRSLLSYIRRGIGSDTGSLSRTILVLTAAGVSPRSFGGRDLVAELRADRRRDGSYDGLVNQTAFAIMALEAAGAGSPGSVRWLKRRQNPSGGYGFNAADGSPEDTGYVLQALAAAGQRNSSTTRRAVAYMEERQRPSGGFAGDGTSENAQATAFALQGLIAAGRSGKEVRRGLRYLRSLQTGNGSIRYARGDGRTPVWVTAQALLALEREAFPIGAVPRQGGGGSRSPSSGAGAGAAQSSPGARAGSAVAGEVTAGDDGGEAGSGDAGGNRGDRRQEDRAERRAASEAGLASARSLEGGMAPPAEALTADLAKGGAAVGARGRGSVVGGMIAAASSAVLVFGLRRRLRRSIAGATREGGEVPG